VNVNTTDATTGATALLRVQKVPVPVCPVCVPAHPVTFYR